MSYPRPLFLTSLVTTLALCGLAACADFETEPGSEAATGAKADGNGCYLHASTVLSKALDNTIAVESENIGVATSAVVAELTQSLPVVSEEDWTDSDPDLVQLTVTSYSDGSNTVRHRITEWNDGDRNEVIQYLEGGYLAFVHADFNGNDGRVDHFRDNVNDKHEADDNGDGITDRLLVPWTADHEIAGYDEGWQPPERPAMVILEDSDFDGFYDVESITGETGALWTRTVCENPQ